MIRVISLPALDKVVSLKAYIKAVKLAKANPHTTFKTGLTTWWPTTGEEIMRQFRKSMHERINDAIPYCNRGVK